MSIKTNRFNPPIVTLMILLVIATVVYPITGLESSSRKLDESTAPGDQGVKCNPSCIQSPPPPPPPSPPPPCPPPPSPPALPPPGEYCPPPPPSCLICVTSPPAIVLYPIDQDFGGANRNLQVGLLGFVCGFLVLLAF